MLRCVGLALLALRAAASSGSADEADAPNAARSLAAAEGAYDALRLDHPRLRPASRRPSIRHGLSAETAARVVSEPSPRQRVSAETVLGDVTIPSLLYGTAWKKGDTARLTLQALAAGFRGYDTATAKKHYNEGGVGDALKVHKGPRPFAQSKFTYARGHDGAPPWGAEEDFAERVALSVAESLSNLGLTRLDALLLHGPSNAARRTGALTEEDLETWAALWEAQAKGFTRYVGVCNVDAALLLRILATGRRPHIVQNRVHASQAWDYEVRALCRAHGIVYQGYSLLTANWRFLKDPALPISRIARRLGKTPEQVVFRFALEVGIVVLTGTRDEAHMAQNVAILGGFELTDADVHAIEAGVLLPSHWQSPDPAE
ncbi:NADP-dependent oxidoreductase domain-containing protein [Pelagophyceae sp. CCMP2097]|nr:NADP-dependent oxidoreductase domain-containing protein [Pelagophyceae sp. CCMP2097]|mmetsp:Transcript_26300/g.90397  ORF Transcript_26300/g.90397 Transcript_26300/m.90397 type:complete len:374 (+) Transcript_26300:207-1328(+)